MFKKYFSHISCVWNKYNNPGSVILFNCAICAAFNFFTLSRKEPSTRKYSAKGHADYLLAICPGASTAACSSASERARGGGARACVYWKKVWTEGGAEPS